MVVHEVSEQAPDGLPDPQSLGQFRFWKAEAQEKALSIVREREQSTWKPFFCTNRRCDGHPHGEWTHEHARADQWPPPWSAEWLTLLLSGGRGSGKTRSGSEITNKVTKNVPRIILIAATGPDLRETMIEGVSGIMATSRPDQRPHWEPSKRKLTWPNGCIGQGFSAEEPDRLRGPESGFVWADEPGHWDLVDDVWDNMMFGLRIKQGLDGSPIMPKIVATSTPKPTKWMKKMTKDQSTIVRRVSTYANIHNLSPVFRDTILSRYEGTRIGRQELHGELLEDVEGAMWNWEMIHYIAEAPELVRIVVAVDPAGTANAKSDETGIIVLGIDADNDIYILEDLTGRYSPERWASKTLQAYDDWHADAIVVEKTYGQDMVKHTLESVPGGRDARIIPVESRRGKALRAEPIVALYERGRVWHVGERGVLGDLEDEQTSWIPGQGASPNRVDALVHGATELAKRTMPLAVADPNKVLSGGWDQDWRTNRRRGPL